MQFGHFDDKRKEYVIDRPDTPKPWSNYLGSTEYGAIITNHAGGYGFFRMIGMGLAETLNGRSLPGNLLPINQCRDTNTVVATLG